MLTTTTKVYIHNLICLYLLSDNYARKHLRHLSFTQAILYLLHLGIGQTLNASPSRIEFQPMWIKNPLPDGCAEMFTCGGPFFHTIPRPLILFSKSSGNQLESLSAQRNSQLGHLQTKFCTLCAFKLDLNTKGSTHQ